jgi:Tol biopolymer transport system component
MESYLLFIQIGTTTAEDIRAMPLEGDRHPFRFRKTPAIETNPALSPDGRWLAVESSQTGRPEVLVTRFTGPRSTVDATAPRLAGRATRQKNRSAQICVTTVPMASCRSSRR